MTKKLKDMLSLADKRNAKLTCDDFDCALVLIRHGDGSCFYVADAKVEWIDEWVIVYILNIIVLLYITKRIWMKIVD